MTVDEHGVAELFVEEMSQLLAALRNDIGEQSFLAGPGRTGPSNEFTGIAFALFDLCASFEFDDCAIICRALASLQAAPAGSPSEPARSLVTEAQAFLERRLERIAAIRTLAPATPEEYTRARELASALRGSVQATDFTQHVPGRQVDPAGVTSAGWDIISDGDDLETDAEQEPLTEAELDLVARFQASTLLRGADIRSRQLDGERVSQGTGDGVSGRGDHMPMAKAEVSEPVDRPRSDGPMWRAHAPSQRVSPTAEELDAIPPEMKRLFLVETAEDLQDMRVALLKLAESPDDMSALHAMRRIAHKIRGSAGTLQYPRCEQIVMVYEDVLKTVAQANLHASPSAHSVLLRGLVILQATLASAEAAGDADEGLLRQADQLTHELRMASEDQPRSLAEPRPPNGAANADSSADSTPVVAGAHETESSLRVDLRRLDTLISHATELTINRAGISHHIEDVGRLQTEMDQSIARLHLLSEQLTDGPALLSSQRRVAGTPELRSNPRPSPLGMSRRSLAGGSGPGHSSPGQPVRWDELELDRLTETDDALRALAEVISDLSANASSLKLALAHLSRLSLSQAELATEIQRDVMHVRLVPLSELVPRLRLEVKGIAQLVHKEVAFSVRGETTHIDRNISDALADPLIQLVRNAVTHGVETPDERVESGKPAAGEVWMHAYYVGSEVVIEIGDDGGGVNPNQVAYSAVFAELVGEDVVRDMSPQEKLDLIFLPGLTRFPKARSVGGQGIGLFGVKAQIEELKGSIQARSEPGSGTVFRVRVPISLSVVRAVHVMVGGETFAVPMSAVQRIEPVTPLDILTVAEQSAPGARPGSTRATRSLRLKEKAAGPTGDQPFEDVPVVSLAELLGLASEPRERQEAVIVEMGRRRVGVLVDDDDDESEVVVQALPVHLRRRAVRGATVMPDGQVRLVLDLPELIAEVDQSDRAARTPWLRPTPRLTRALAPRVLVVDDSVSIRRTLELTLSRAHFDVQLARDGVEALELMLVTPPRVVVLDIEMPRLDGFELLGMMRETPQFEQVRVVMLTSRASDKHRQHAQALGASAYLVKPCPQEILIDTVRGLLEEQPAQ